MTRKRKNPHPGGKAVFKAEHEQPLLFKFITQHDSSWFHEVKSFLCSGYIGFQIDMRLICHYSRLLYCVYSYLKPQIYRHGGYSNWCVTI